MQTKYATSFLILREVEYSNKPELFLHRNENEDLLTIGGVYEKWHKNLDWTFIRNILNSCGGDIERASILLHSDSKTLLSVFASFKTNFWDMNKLDEVQSQLMCNEIFLSSVHIGSKNAVKLAQRVVGVKDDGIIGNMTLKALNVFNEDLFDIEFDKKELEYYEKTIQRNPELKYAAVGFENRAYRV